MVTKIVTSKAEGADSEPLQAGDNFVYFSKHGGEVYGVVQEVNHVTCKSLTLNYTRVHVVSTKGNTYELGEVYKVTKTLNEEEQITRKKLFDEMQNLKSIKDLPTLKTVMDLRRLEKQA